MGRRRQPGGSEQHARAPGLRVSLIFPHEKSTNARSVAMIDAIAVANAEVHADFR